MKKYLFAAFLALVLTASPTDAQEKYLQFPVSHVTVFRQGAQLSGELTVSLQAGTWDYVAGGLSPYIDPNSIQVRGEGDFIITGVSHRNNYLENPSESETISGLREKIKVLELKIEDEETTMGILKEKEVFLKSNYDIVTNKSAITPDQLRALMDIYSANIESVRTAVLKKQRIIKEYSEEKDKLEKQLSGTLDKSRMPTGEIVVTVTSGKPVTGRLRLSYMVNNAGWRPSYDIRVDDISDPAVIVYKAGVWQNSGIDWKDVKISLSNSEPMTAGALPPLNPWFIDFYTPQVMFKGLAGKAAGINISSKRESALVVDDEEVMEAESVPMPVTINESNISFSFDVNLPKTIVSGGKPETVELQRLTVPATYSYAATPKLASSAYLMGYITDWEKYNLLPGESNIYFSNTFTGKGYINTLELTDTLPVSLGADNNITVKRERRTDYTSQKLIGANRIETKSFLISVRNNKSKAVNVRLRDQIPLSQNSSIIVEAVELTGGKHDIVTGVITWDLVIQPRETKEIILTYSVRYPKNQKVILE
jgi:uncharacterized protein (TIGR02231 family)